MIAVLKFPSLIPEYYRLGWFGFYDRCYTIKYIKIPFHKGYNYCHKICKDIKRRNQLRKCNRYD